MTTFYIYEVPGDKNGATKDWLNRKRFNFSKYHIQPILIETMEGPDDEDMWQLVGDREWYYADLNGYDRGTHYRVMRVKANHNNRIPRFYKGQPSPSPGNHTEGAKKGGYVMSSKKRTCSHCGLVSNGPVFYRYHENNCKLNPKKGQHSC
tara:strand:+ start:15 stop:464 length:450 start_codon:yes stop_codon:yes gene_type:complete